ncbi:uncharacterized protein [Prorops nasuta]|uniref:uncharacterized protein n=1 Tax=Prorops nasuta TaxID=863751 RepID=UPI0034CE7E6E
MLKMWIKLETVFSIIILFYLPLCNSIQSGYKRSTHENESRTNNCNVINSLQQYGIMSALRCVMGGFRAASPYQTSNFGLNMLSISEIQNSISQALISVAQYDEFKCVPRILCEMTSGSVLSGTHRQMPDILQNLGQNTLFGLLAGFGSPQISPIIHFSKAALLGFINRGNSDICYREYPKCPRNQNQLIYYLNNYNGGLFRFFNKAGISANQQYYSQHYQRAISPGYLKNRRKSASRAIVFTSEPENRTGRGELKFDKPLYNLSQNNKKYIFLRQPEERGDTSRISFPIQDQPEKEVLKESGFFPGEEENGNKQIRYPS